MYFFSFLFIFYFIFLLQIIFKQKVNLGSCQMTLITLQLKFLPEIIAAKIPKERKRLTRSTPFDFIDTFFSFHYCNVCKLLNGVFVQQFSDLYLSEVMGGKIGPTVEAESPREPYFTAEAIALTCTITHTLTHVEMCFCCWKLERRVEGDSVYQNIDVVRWLDGGQ